MTKRERRGARNGMQQRDEPRPSGGSNYFQGSPVAVENGWGSVMQYLFSWRWRRRHKRWLRAQVPETLEEQEANPEVLAAERRVTPRDRW